MSTQLVGKVFDRDDAAILARRLWMVDPEMAKRYETVWDNYSVEIFDTPVTSYTRRYNKPLDRRIVDAPLSEQEYWQVKRLLLNIDLCFFVISPDYHTFASSKEQPMQDVVFFSMFDEEQGHYLNPVVIAAKREELLKRDGLPIDQVLAEIERRTATLAISAPLPQSPPAPKPSISPLHAEGTLE